jgi:hypothetical protein
MRTMEPRLLYFTKSAALTPEDREAAYNITSNVGFRNGAAPVGDRLEECDAVAGHPPKAYAEAYFTVTSKKTFAKAVKDKNDGKVPDPVDEPDADEDEDEDEVVVDIVPPVEDDLTDKSDDFKAGYADGKAKKEYGDAAELSDDFKAGFTAGMTYNVAVEGYEAQVAEAKAKAKANTAPEKAAARRNKPKPPPNVPNWGKN